MARTSSARPSGPRKSNGHANGGATVLAADADPGQTPPPGFGRKKRVKVPPELLAWAMRRSEGRRNDRIVPPRQRDGKPLQPFGLLQHFPPVVQEALKQLEQPTIAQDEFLSDTAVWANEAAGAFVEGTAFLGYAFLSTLAQRPEFRVVSEEIAGEMTREWIELRSKGGTTDKNDKIKVLQDDMEAFKLQEVFRDAAENDGLLGRGHIFIDTGDSDNREELKQSIGKGDDEISKTKITRGKLRGFKSVEATWCYPQNYNSSDPLADDWYSPRSWVVMSKQVHSTRFLTMIGRKVPDMLKPAYAFGGLSLSQMMMPYVDNWLRTRQSVADLLEAFSLMVLATAMDADMGEGNADLYSRVDFFNNTRNNRGMIVVDKETEEVSNVAAPLGTLDALQAQSQEHLASVSRIPIVKLLGIQPAGLNASSEGEIRSFYDWIHSFQEKLFREPLTTCLNFIQLNRYGEIDPDITFVFKDLWQIDDAQAATVEQTKAATHEAYLQMNVVQPEDIRKTLTADPDSPYAGIELEELPAPPPPDLASLGLGGAGGAPGAVPQQPGGGMHRGGVAGAGPNGAAPQAPHAFAQPPHPAGSAGAGVSIGGAKPGSTNPGGTKAGGITVSHVNPGKDAMIRAGALDTEAFDWDGFDATWSEGQHPRGQPKNKGQFAKGQGGGQAAPAAPAQPAGGGGTPRPASQAPAAQPRAPAAPERPLSNTTPTSNQPQPSVHEQTASDLLKSVYPAPISMEQFLLGEPRQLVPAIAEAEAKLKGGVSTDADVSEGGFKAGGQWTAERQRVHDQIVAKILTPEAVARALPAPGQQPSFTVLGGRGGSGKSWFTKPGGAVDTQHALLLDNDAIKTMLPGYQGWNAALLHEEASDIFEQVDAQARELGLNIVHDATLRSYGSAHRRVQAYKAAGYRVSGHYMFTPPPLAAHRSCGRFLGGGETGRYVSVPYILSSTTNEQSFDALRPELDDWTLYSNAVQGAEPTLISRKQPMVT